MPKFVSIVKIVVAIGKATWHLVKQIKEVIKKNKNLLNYISNSGKLSLLLNILYIHTFVVILN